MNRINYGSGWPLVLTIDHENHRFLGRCTVIVRVKSHKIHVLTRTQVTTCRQCAWHRLQRWPACVEETNVVRNQLQNLTRGYHDLSVRIIIFLSYLDVMYVCTRWHYFKWYAQLSPKNYYSLCEKMFQAKLSLFRVGHLAMITNLI